jgi:hypothetical protein
MDQLRVFLVYIVVITALNVLLRALVWDSVVIVIATALWAAIGLRRVFNGRPPQAASLDLAVKAVTMTLAWPLLPRQPR